MNKIEYKNQFNREKYDRIGLMLPKGKGEEWKAEAKERGLSINALVQKAMDSYLKGDKLDNENKIV